MSNTVTISVVTNAAKASRSLRGVAGDVQSVGKSSGRAKAAVAGLAGGFVGNFGAEALRGAVNAAKDHQIELGKLGQAMKVNAGLSGTTVDALKAQASATESLTGSRLDEDDVLRGQSRLLRAGIVGRKNYDDAVLASANLAVGTNTTAEAASKVLAKALANPAKAAGALARSGVILTKSQTDQIAAFQKAGDAAGAQTVILDAVSKKYDGVAAAAGGTLAGQLGNLQDQFQDTARDLATQLLPAATGILGVLLKFAPVILPVAGALLGLAVAAKAVSAAQTIAAGATAAYQGVLQVGAAASKVFAAGQWLVNIALTANPIGLVVAALSLLVIGLVVAYKKSATFRAIVNGTFKAITTTIGKFVTFIGGAASAIGGFFGNLVDSAKSIGGQIFRGILGGIAAAYNALPGIVKSGIEKLPGLGGVGKALNAAANAPTNTVSSQSVATGASVVQNNYYQVKNVPTEREKRIAAARALSVNGR